MTRNRSWFPWHRRDHPTHPALRKVHDERTFGERIADQMAAFGGSWPFIFVFVGLILAWAVLNSVVLARVLHDKPFDPYPYIALNLVLSALAGLQAPVIMMSQNRAAARDEALAAHHYDETQKIDHLLQANTELTEKVHRLTEQIHRLTVEVRAQFGASAERTENGPTTSFPS
jgi:uncharacterized membrane protein